MSSASPDRRRGCRLALPLGASLALRLSWLLAAGAAGAAPLVHEPFAYTAGTVLDGVPAAGVNLEGSYTAIGTSPAQQLTVVSSGLDYGSLVGAPTASGQRISDVLGVTPAGATVSVGEDVVVDPGSAIFWSALFTFDDSANGNHLANITLTDDATGDQIFFGEPAVGTRGIRVAATTVATGETVADGADGAFADGATLFLVGRYVNGASPGSDSLDLIGYDTALATVLPSSFDPADPNAAFAYGLEGLDIDLSRIRSLLFTIRGADNNFIDELRIGTTYGDVVPEPGTAPLLLLGLTAIAARARRVREGGVRTAYASRIGTLA